MDKASDLAQRLLIGKDLPAFGLLAQTSGQIGYVTYRRVVHPPLETEIAQGGVARGQTDAEMQVVAFFEPALAELRYSRAHGQRHLHRPGRVILARYRVIEENHDSIAGKMLQG